jgi:DNA-binding XRE family transcriptional regulator
MEHEDPIGQSYVPLPDNWGMRKPEKSFLDRAMEALADKYKGERVTQMRLAKLAGVSQPAVSDWGKGAGPELDKGIKLATQLGVCVEWLYTGRGPKRPAESQPADEHLSPILQVWPQLDEKTRKQIARYADFIRDDTK